MPAVCRLAVAVFVANVLIFCSSAGRCQDDAVGVGLGNGSMTAAPNFSQVLHDQFMIYSESLAAEMIQHLGFCIDDPVMDWNGAFNFSADLGFVGNCIKEINGDIRRRLCTAAEIKFYFSSFLINGGNSSFLRPNRNCNITTWVSGCEPGWACGAGEDQKVQLTDANNMPSRTQNCLPCCEGFFCPRGAYCPRAMLDKSTGVCGPYKYEAPPGQTNHSCGGADRWADVVSSGCFKKSSCKPNSVNQDITIFGVLLMFAQAEETPWACHLPLRLSQSEPEKAEPLSRLPPVAMSLILLIIYNFSGQILTNRDRRQAKSREAAAICARETAQAREKWKAAKDIAKKHAVELQTQLSRTFSRKHSVKSSGQDTSDVLPIHSKPSTSSNKEPNHVIQLVHSLEDDPGSSGGFNLQIGDKNIKKNMTKGKKIHTRSQIFKYAYGQIEKEKVMQQQTNNLTFSGVISMAADIERRTRPEIEIAFNDLTLTLKGSKKHLLKSVTGKLMPGRVAAVMGPSGAGKTTFLSALAGKTTGFDVSGSVLINGEVESIRSYKKIIGFVPQDDIVHGNLTVEENLWFSARCRLSADMSKADKVLVVERVIESLGLQPVRDSLVGTVEKRGISGGQRKRVNVGLEMVMEPSLLILDEPTSGLDSASSQLLLRALRREALEGSTILCHIRDIQLQEMKLSYTLFRMFDDLVILAKGGLIVYLGAVKKVEEYFSDFGIVVPERVNPPDYFIDILEGIIKPPGIDVGELPLRWMLLNGYNVPPFMLQNQASTSSGGINEQPISGELWNDTKNAIEHIREHIEQSLSKAKDLSNRRTPGVLQQYRLFLGRVGKQRLRDARLQGIDYLILCLAGVCLGTLAKVRDESFGAVGYTYTVIAVSLLCKIGALRSFSLDKLHYWRERASGMSSLAYFLSKDTIDQFNTLVKPVVYLSMFYFFNNPRSSILDNFIILVALVYCVTGIGYVFAICFQPGSAQLPQNFFLQCSALLPVVLTLIATQQRDSNFLSNLCYTKWALEGFVLANAERYSGVWLITRCASLMKYGYNIHEWNLCIVVLVAYGLLSRCFAFICMVSFLRK
ncbi:Putative white-brown complex like protein 30 [Dendrobium catenatum]|uniref:White-brown complex like protein 30 n=1 Tax=Dendrobium catenatum TaxID=906689 RepID=A0A2I0VPE4_9ASPA|nr:Putative white-brown complex like protein 30 [Dendrobium catenatum]